MSVYGLGYCRLTEKVSYVSHNLCNIFQGFFPLYQLYINASSYGGCLNDSCMNYYLMYTLEKWKLKWVPLPSNLKKSDGCHTWTRHWEQKETIFMGFQNYTCNAFAEKLVSGVLQENFDHLFLFCLGHCAFGLFYNHYFNIIRESCVALFASIRF